MSWSVLLIVLIGGAWVVPLGCTSGSNESPSTTSTGGQTAQSGATDEPAAPVLPPTQPPADRNNLETMETAWLTVKGRSLVAWLARTPTEQMYGLMQVTGDEMAPLPNGTERGMLFVFPDEAPRGFWMYNTIIPLDIAYLASDGTVVKTHTMPPLTTQSFPSVAPARFALEVTAGLLGSLGVEEGDKIEIPASVLKTGR